MLPEGWIGWMAAGLFVVLAVVLGRSSILFTSEFVRKNENDHFRIQLRALGGLLRYRLEIPIVRFVGNSVEFKHEKSNSFAVGQSSNEGRHRVGAETVMRKIEQARLLLRYTDHFTSWLRRALSYVRITDWRWDTSVGTGDAAWTAITTGMIWSAQTGLLGLLSQFTRLSAPPRTTVQPLYNQTYFSTEWRCIAEISLGKAMFAGLQLLVRIRKVKGGFSVWQNTLFKA